MKHLLGILALVAALSVSAALAQSDTPATPAEAAAYGLVGTGFPVAALVIYTADTDPNHLLGRPGQYTGKVAWHDMRTGDDIDIRESTVETFDTLPALQQRATYINALVAATPLFAQYVFEDDAHLALLRLPFGLTPEQAAEYQAWLAAL